MVRVVDTTTGLTRSGLLFVAAITALSVAHHVDHVVRGSTGWPFDGGFNPFSASLFVYPVIAIGVLLSLAGRVGARFWTVLAGGAAVFVTAVHLGPAAGDAVQDIPGSYELVGRRHPRGRHPRRLRGRAGRRTQPTR